MTAPEYQGQDLPLPVQRAIARLMDPELPVTLSACEKMALAALLRRVEARDGTREFWVRRCNMAATFDCVERTITNWLAALERKGLIVKEQGRTRWGNFKSLTLQLSGLAVRLLGLDGQACATLSTAAGKKTSFGHKKEVYREQSPSERHSASPASSKPNSRNTPQVPADCVALLSMGLTAPAVFKLMAIARRNGKRLGDILRARGPQIAAADNPYALAFALATDGVDYAAVGKALEEEEQAHAAEADRKSAMEEAQERCVGQEFLLTPGRKARVGRGFAEVFDLDGQAWRYVGALAGQPLLAFWQRLAAGELQAVP